MDNFSQTPVTPNTQGESENMILTSEMQNNSDALAETFKGLTINNTGYYESDSANANYAEGDPASDPKLATYTSDGKKERFWTLATEICKKKSNRTLLIITTAIDPWIDNRVANFWSIYDQARSASHDGVYQRVGSPDSWTCNQDLQGQ